MNIAAATVTPADLIKQYHQLNAWIEAEMKRLDEYFKPHKEKLDQIKNQLLAMANELKVDSFPTDYGTAYKSTIVTPKITDKEKYLDWVLENWNDVGDMLQVGAPQKKAVEAYMQEHDGKLPPFVEISSFTRMNINKA